MGNLSKTFGKLTIPLLVLLTISFSVNTAVALDGSGTQQDPWRIKSLADFNDFAADANYWASYTRLETDVNLAGPTYTTAVIALDTSGVDGFQGTAFTGVFDGNNHKIINLSITSGTNDYLGLFGYISYINGGEVRNLGVERGSVGGDLYIGGLVGYNLRGSVSNCYSTGNVSGEDNVGGLVGINENGIVLHCYSTGSVSGTQDVGGLVGGNVGRISNCYSTADASGEDNVGGLVGENGLWGQGIVSNCYSTGSVSGTQHFGGLVGYNNFWGIVLNSFWDVQTSGQLVSDGGTGKTTAEMQTESTFTDVSWDFLEIWSINNGATYPVLRQEIRSDLNDDGGVDFADFAIFADHWLEGK
ncbi:MAG: GLUG motif-containing protein [Planctomycetota bacterium]|jgi:hypothetical protein